jgi:hypothetical protein
VGLTKCELQCYFRIIQKKRMTLGKARHLESAASGLGSGGQGMASSSEGSRGGDVSNAALERRMHVACNTMLASFRAMVQMSAIKDGQSGGTAGIADDLRFEQATASIVASARVLADVCEVLKTDMAVAD